MVLYEETKAWLAEGRREGYSALTTVSRRVYPLPWREGNIRGGGTFWQLIVY